jgi:ATP/maltotriose-dependent transcriptional regulator MalT
MLVNPALSFAARDALLQSRVVLLQAPAGFGKTSTLADSDTVKRHVANILDKLAVGSRGQAAAWLRERGSAVR